MCKSHAAKCGSNWMIGVGLLVSVVAHAVPTNQTLLKGSVNATSGTGKLTVTSPKLAETAHRPIVTQYRQNPNQPLRLLVKLTEQPLTPYLTALRKAQASEPKVLRATQQQRLSKAAQSHQQKLVSNQTRLLNDLRRNKLLDKVHYQFTDLTNAISITASAQQAEKIRQLPQVAGVYPDNKVQALLDDSVPAIGAPTLWAMKDTHDDVITGKGVVVAVLDSGVDYTHPDLGGCIGLGCKVIGGANFIAGQDENDPMDVNGHGTHVAGIIAANGTLRGVAPDANIYAVKVLDDFGTGQDSEIIAGLERAADPDGDPLTDDKVDVINMSLGGGGAFDSPLSEAANAAVDAGIVVVVAAGNAGAYFTVGSPGNAKQVLTVGATNNNHEITDFSSRGPVHGADFIKPEISAPGDNINSAAPGGSYAVLSGTSMATPHVAGGVALLKQLHPELTPDEMKSLLLSTAKDIGEDVFTQGAGRMDLVAAANAEWILSPSLLSFGFVDIAQPQWQAEQPVTLKNISTHDIALTPPALATLPLGVSLTHSIADNMVVAAGESQVLTFAVDVNTQALPFSESRTLHHEFGLALASAEQHYRLPLVLFKAAQLKLELTRPLSGMWLFDENGDEVYSFSSFCEEEEILSLAVNLRPGTYSGLWDFADDENCSRTDAVLFYENILLSGITNFNVRAEDAVHNISVAQILDKSGVAVAQEELFVSNLCMQFWHSDWLNLIFNCNGFSSLDELIKINTVPEKFNLGIMLSAESLSVTSDDTAIYLLQDVFNEGIDKHQSLALDAQNSGSVTFEYADAVMLAQGVDLSIKYSQLLGVDAYTAMSTYGITHYQRYDPFKLTVYSTLSTLELGEWYPAFEVSKYTEEYIYAPPLFDSRNVAFVEQDAFVKVSGSFFQPTEIFYHNSDNLLLVNDGGFYMSAYFQFNKRFDDFFAFPAEGCIFCSGLQKDMAKNIFNEDFPYHLSCNNEVISDGEISGNFYAYDATIKDCDTLVLDVDMPTRFLGEIHDSEIQVTLKPQTATEEFEAIYPPVVTDLVLLNDGDPSRILYGTKAEVIVSVEDDSDHSTLDVLLEYRLDDAVSWTNLILQRNDSTYTAEVPVGEGSHQGSLQLTVTDLDGNQVKQTLNKIFVIGSDAGDLLTAPPNFEPLADITMEATAPLSVYAPAVTVTAQTLTGAVVTASLITQGPFAVGVHELIWQATTPTGVVGQAVQTLRVVDTTPPVLVAPVSITRQSSQPTLAINLGTVAATDLVDGNIFAVADMTGPFAIGTHTVTWTATDAAGNSANVTQTVTVTAAPASVTSSPPKTSSDKSGGSSGLWLFMFLAVYGVMQGRFAGRNHLLS